MQNDKLVILINIFIFIINSLLPKNEYWWILFSFYSFSHLFSSLSIPLPAIKYIVISEGYSLSEDHQFMQEVGWLSIGVYKLPICASIKWIPYKGKKMITKSWGRKKIVQVKWKMDDSRMKDSSNLLAVFQWPDVKIWKGKATFYLVVPCSPIPAHVVSTRSYVASHRCTRCHFSFGRSLSSFTKEKPGSADDFFPNESHKFFSNHLIFKN